VITTSFQVVRTRHQLTCVAAQQCPLPPRYYRRHTKSQTCSSPPEDRPHPSSILNLTLVLPPIPSHLQHPSPPTTNTLNPGIPDRRSLSPTSTTTPPFVPFLTRHPFFPPICGNRLNRIKRWPDRAAVNKEKCLDTFHPITLAQPHDPPRPLVCPRDRLLSRCLASPSVATHASPILMSSPTNTH
jgi:hypothetical protein